MSQNLTPVWLIVLKNGLVCCLFRWIKGGTNTQDQTGARIEVSMKSMKSFWCTFCLIWPLLTDILRLLKAENENKKITTEICEYDAVTVQCCYTCSAPTIPKGLKQHGSSAHYEKKLALYCQYRHHPVMLLDPVSRRGSLASQQMHMHSYPRGGGGGGGVKARLVFMTVV